MTLGDTALNEDDNTDGWVALQLCTQEAGGVLLAALDRLPQGAMYGDLSGPSWALYLKLLV